MPVAADDPSSRSRLGDYEIGPQVAEDGRSVTCEADQISVRRRVLLECLRPAVLQDEAAVEVFLEDVRAKAALDHPVIASVYEAVRGEEVVFYTREKLPGRPLGDLHAHGECLDPRQILRMLVRLGEAYDYLGERGVKTEPLETRHLLFAEPDLLRLENLAVHGAFDPASRWHDRQVVSALFSDLVAPGRPGATRTGRLLSILASDDPPHWASVAHTAGKLADSLVEEARALSGEPGASRPIRSRRWMPVVLWGGLLLLVALAAVGGAYLIGRQTPPAARVLDQMVEVSGAKAFDAEGGARLLPSYWIDAQEVTIAEYADFLKSLGMVAEAQRNAYDHPDQPATKRSHEPAGWKDLRAAAERGKEWQGVQVDLNCPIVNVDWWDAYAYANWRGGRLPTQAEWFAAAAGEAPKGSGWGPVDASSIDRTSSGLQGLAGNVTEWIHDLVVNPATPMNPAAPISCGASYLQPQNGSLVRFWHPSRDTRRVDLGIRVLREAAP